MDILLWGFFGGVTFVVLHILVTSLVKAQCKELRYDLESQIRGLESKVRELEYEVNLGKGYRGHEASY